ncbi:MAG: EamA family transporter [Halobacteriovoraceae bacterium]|nr:EamA family transporter [Halobacteriovoraceae bacterium]
MGVLLIFLACIAWSLDTLIRYPLLSSSFTSIDIVFYEHLFLGILFVPTFLGLIKTKQLFKKENLTSFIVIGIFGSAISTLSFTKAFSLINPSIVILLQKFQPVIAITLSYFILGEKVDKKFIFWAFVCVIGGFIISYKQIASGMDFKSLNLSGYDRNSILGLFFSALAVIGWGSATVFGKKLSLNGVTVPQVMSGRFIFGLLGMLPFVPFLTSNSIQSDFISKIILLVLLSGVLGIFFYYNGLKRVPAKVATLAELFFPFCAVIINWIFLDTSLDILQILGGVILIFGSTVIQLNRY